MQLVITLRMLQIGSALIALHKIKFTYIYSPPIIYVRFPKSETG